MGIFDFLTKSAPRKFDDVIAALDNRAYGVGSSESALKVSTVFACIKVIADGCATPNLNIYREQKDGRRELATNIPEYRILNRRPNEWQTSFEWRRTMTAHAALTGNAFSFIVRGENKRVKELIPILPSSVQVIENSRYDVRYHVSDKFGKIGIYTDKDIFHLPNFHWDYVKGMDAVDLARQAIGLAQSAEQSQAKLQENGGRPSGILTTEQKIGDEARLRLKASWEEYTRQNRGGTAVLDGGWSYSQISMTAVDAQHIETRRLQIEEVCRGFGVFPMMIGHTDKTSTFASAEAFFSAHLKHTLAPWHQAWVQRLDEFILDGTGPLFAEFDTRYLTAGSVADRAQFTRTMVEMGVYTRNEIRDQEGLDPIDGLDEPLTPMNMDSGKEEPPKEEVADEEKFDAAGLVRATGEAMIDAVKSITPPVVNIDVKQPSVNVAASKIDIQNIIPKRGAVEKTASFGDDGRLTKMIEREIDE